MFLSQPSPTPYPTPTPYTKHNIITIKPSKWSSLLQLKIQNRRTVVWLESEGIVLLCIVKALPLKKRYRPKRTPALTRLLHTSGCLISRVRVASCVTYHRVFQTV